MENITFPVPQFPREAANRTDLTNGAHIFGPVGEPLSYLLEVYTKYKCANSIDLP